MGGQVGGDGCEAEGEQEGGVGRGTGKKDRGRGGERKRSVGGVGGGVAVGCNIIDVLLLIVWLFIASGVPDQ